MNIGRHILVCGLSCYRQIFSPMKVFVLGPGAACRFTPSCSQYASDAIGRHGAWAGVWLAVRRVARCHPWGGCGYDPVPDRDRRG